jgi:5-methyltetrahydropteroyltriglutamate--homocysteine methyltransferase
MVGCVDLSTSEVESPQTIAARIRKALKFMKPENVVLAPDCGMKYLPRASADGKLRAMVEAAKILRTEHR